MYRIQSHCETRPKYNEICFISIHYSSSLTSIIPESALLIVRTKYCFDKYESINHHLSLQSGSHPPTDPTETNLDIRVFAWTTWMGTFHQYLGAQSRNGW